MTFRAQDPQGSQARLSRSDSVGRLLGRGSYPEPSGTNSVGPSPALKAPNDECRPEDGRRTYRHDTRVPPSNLPPGQERCQTTPPKTTPEDYLPCTPESKSPGSSTPHPFGPEAGRLPQTESHPTEGRQDAT